jgi:hypothetical protein
MTREIPAPLRAAAGLAAVAVDEARRLPTRLAGLPVVALGAALQASMRVQQRYAELIGRGDQVLSGMREHEEQPPWAHFDEDERAPNGKTAAYRPDADGWAFADEEISELAEDAAAYDEYMPAGDPPPAPPAEPRAEPAIDAPLPLADYDRLSLPQLRARLARLSTDDLAALLAHERQYAARPPYLTMLENRLNRIRKP